MAVPAGAAERRGVQQGHPRAAALHRRSGQREAGGEGGGLHAGLRRPAGPAAASGHPRAPRLPAERAVPRARPRAGGVQGHARPRPAHPPGRGRVLGRGRARAAGALGGAQRGHAGAEPLAGLAAQALEGDGQQGEGAEVAAGAGGAPAGAVQAVPAAGGGRRQGAAAASARLVRAPLPAPVRGLRAEPRGQQGHRGQIAGRAVAAGQPPRGQRAARLRSGHGAGGLRAHRRRADPPQRPHR